MSDSDSEARTEAWIENEPGLAGTTQELARLLRRGRARWYWTLLFTTLVTGGVLFDRAQTPERFTARHFFRLTEGNIDAAASIRPPRQVREYVSDVALSSTRLSTVIEKLDLYPRERALGGMLAAVSSMRDDLVVDVYSNYFLEERRAREAPRSARMELRFTARNRKVAQAVVTELGELVVEEDASRRRDQTAAAAREAQQAYEVARADLLAKQERLTEQRMALTTAEPEEIGGIHIAISHLLEQLHAADARVARAEQRRTDLNLRTRMESENLGLRFELVDEKMAVKGGSTPAGLAFLGVIVFVLVLPLVAMAVGAFDDRVYDLEDIQRLGLDTVGQLPAFAGSEAGSMAWRRRQSTRL